MAEGWCGGGTATDSPACQQPSLCHSESGSPPPSLHPPTNHRSPAHCGTADSRPAHARPASLLRAGCLPALGPEPSPFAPAGIWLPDLPPAAPGAATGAGPRGCGALPAAGRHRPDAVFFALGTPLRESGETEMVKHDSGFSERLRHSCAEGPLQRKRWEARSLGSLSANSGPCPNP